MPEAWGWGAGHRSRGGSRRQRAAQGPEVWTLRGAGPRLSPGSPRTCARPPLPVRSGAPGHCGAGSVSRGARCSARPPPGAPPGSAPRGQGVAASNLRAVGTWFPRFGAGAAGGSTDSRTGRPGVLGWTLSPLGARSPLGLSFPSSKARDALSLTTNKCSLFLSSGLVGGHLTAKLTAQAFPENSVHGPLETRFQESPWNVFVSALCALCRGKFERGRALGAESNSDAQVASLSPPCPRDVTFVPPCRRPPGAQAAGRRMCLRLAATAPRPLLRGASRVCP